MAKDFTTIPITEEKSRDERKQIPLRMPQELFDRLETKAKSESKSVNALVCEAVEARLSDQPDFIRKDDVRVIIRQAIEAQTRIWGWNVDAAVIQRAIYDALKIDTSEKLPL